MNLAIKYFNSRIDRVSKGNKILKLYNYSRKPYKYSLYYNHNSNNKDTLLIINPCRAVHNFNIHVSLYVL